MEAKAALVGADRGVVLNTETAVHVHFAAVVNPGNTEFNDTLGLNKTLDQCGLFPFGMFVDDKFQRFKDFTDCLQKFRFMGVAFLYFGIDPLQILVCKHKCLLVNCL